jgi:hypothetical protein
MGFNGLIDHSFEVEVIANEYSDLINYVEQVRTLMKSIEFTTQTYYIQAVVIEDSQMEVWDSETKLNRKMLSFAVSYQK